MGFAIAAEGLRKRYGDVSVARLPAERSFPREDLRPSGLALDGLDLAVPAGTVCGVLGPNGAGKTTAIRILATLLRPDGGRAEVAGFDVAAEPMRVRRHIGLVGQHAAVDELLSGTQNLVMFGRLYHLDAAAARRRSAELLDRFGLAEAASKPARDYSGGMRRRLDIAASLILNPPVLFLDEPTTGLDPRGRMEVWEALRGLVAGGTTVLLTTQHLDEADQLADEICVIDAGRAIAHGTPAALKTAIGVDRIDIVVTDAAAVSGATAALARVAVSPPSVSLDARRISAPVADRMKALAEVLRELDRAGIAPEDISLRRPTLDEVFLRLTEPDHSTTTATEVAA